MSTVRITLCEMIIVDGPLPNILDIHSLKENQCGDHQTGLALSRTKSFVRVTYQAYFFFRSDLFFGTFFLVVCLVVFLSNPLFNRPRVVLKKEVAV